jgi:hypothetical protein
MTAIFLVWNKTGLALAADQSVSATSRDEHGNAKVLFTSTETKIYRPEGRNFLIASAGNANINGIPIQGIINQWSRTCPELSSLSDYADSFIKWLATSSLLENCIPDYSESEDYLKTLLRALVDEYLRESKASNNPNMENIARSRVKDWEMYCPPNIYGFAPEKFSARNSNNIDKQDYINFVSRFADFRLDNENQSDFIATVDTLFNTCFVEVFEENSQILESEPELQDALRPILTKFFIDYVSNRGDRASLMFVGYGEYDWTPICIKIDVLDFDLALPRVTVERVTHPGAVWYQNLGQTDAVSRFWNPMSMEVKKEMTQKLQEQFGKKTYLPKVLGTIDEVIGSHDDDFVGPIRDKIELIGVEQLAFVAQQLVSLESFKSFINEYLPTVGGKIDCITLTRST